MIDKNKIDNLKKNLQNISKYKGENKYRAILHLHGGPLDGTIHEGYPGFPTPQRVGLIHKENRYYYNVVDKDNANYTGKSEKYIK